MTVTSASFRQSFKAFDDPSIYDDDSVNMFIGIAGGLLNAGRWGAQLDYGTSLFVAHHLILMARDNATARAGGIPGTVQGVITSKSVDKVAVGYDAKSVSLTDGAFWNMTTYGIRFLQLARYMGTGPVQVNFGPGGPMLN
jgi:hypothetical protein